LAAAGPVVQDFFQGFESSSLLRCCGEFQPEAILEKYHGLNCADFAMLGYECWDMNGYIHYSGKSPSY
jgi:hypothetical protein